MNETIIGKNCSAALHIDDSGFYQGIRELVVAVVTSFDGKPFDWAAYRAFVPANMDIELGKKIVSDKGDKLYPDDAHLLFPNLNEVPYRS